MKRNIIKILAAAVMCSSVTAVGNYYTTSEAYGADTSQEENVGDTNVGEGTGSAGEDNSTENTDDKKDDTENNDNTENKDDSSEGTGEDKGTDSSDEDSKKDTETTYDIVQRINIGSGTLEDYEKLKITGVSEKNIVDVNWFIKKDNVDSTARIQTDVDTILNAIAAINVGTITVSYYETAGIDGVLSDNIELAKAAVLKAKESKGSTLTRSEIIKVCDEDVLSVLKRAEEGTASLDDYSKLNVEGVTESNLTGVNWYVKKNNCRTLSQIKGYAKSMIDSLAAINAGTATSGNYVVLGIYTVDDFSCIAANKAVAGEGKVLTREEIVKLVDETITDYIKKIQSGEAEVSDYTNLGLTDVTADNLEAVNYYVKKSGSTTASNIEKDINTANVAFKAINEGKVSIDFCKIIGIEGVNEDNIDMAGDVISEARASKGSNLTKSEMQNVINEKIINHLKKIKDGEGTLDDYSSLNITGVTAENLKDVNWYAKEKKAGTITAIQSAVKELTDALINVNSTSAVLKSFTTLKIDGVNSGNLGNAKSVIKAARTVKGSDLTRDEIIKAVNEGVLGPVSRIQDGNGTLDDYTSLGITGVTDYVLDDVNWMNKNNKNETVGDISTNTSAMISALTIINKGTQKISYYEKLGINLLTNDNIVYMESVIKSKRASKGTNLKREEIVNDVLEALKNADDALARMEAGNATVNDYTTILIDVVTEVTLPDVNWYEKEKGFGGLKDAKNNATTFLAALTAVNKISRYQSDYKTVGVQDLNDDNFAAVKKAVTAAKAGKGGNLTRTEILSAAGTVTVPINNAVEKIKNGQGTVSDYELIGITTVTGSTLSDANWFVTKSKSETAANIKTAVNNLNSAVDKINKGSTYAPDYATIDIKTVTSKNSAGIKKAILTAKAEKGENLTVEEIRRTVDSALNTSGSGLEDTVKDTVNKIAAGNGTITDYRTINIESVTEANLQDVNSVIKTRVNKNVTDIKTNVNAILNALTSVNKGTTTISYYKTLAIDAVTQENISRVKAAVLAAVKLKGSSLNIEEINQAINDSEGKIQEIISKISQGNGELADYKAIGITTVTTFTLDDVNWYAKTNDSTTVYNITTNTDKILKALTDINNGTTYASVYTNAKIDGVDSDNIGRVKQQVIAEKAAKGRSLNRAEIIKVVEDKVVKPLKDLQEGNGTVEEYKLIGITNVTEGTLADVNLYVKNHDNKTVAQIKNSVTAILSALSTANAGTTDLKVYETLGISTVNSDNVSYVKGAILAARSAKGSDLTKAEISNAVTNGIAHIAGVINKIGAGNGQVSDYQELGISYVTTANLEDVNWYVKSKADSTINTEEIKLNSKVIIDALNTINVGTTYADYYVTLGITTVTSDNSAKVKDAVLAAKSAKGSYLTKAEIAAAVNSALNTTVNSVV